MTSFLLQRCLSVLMALVISPSIAYGYAPCDDHKGDLTPFIHAVAFGGKNEIGSIAKHYVDQEEEHANIFLKLKFKISPKNRLHWHKERIAALVENSQGLPVKPLDYAVQFGNIEAVEFLLENGADPSAYTYENGSNVQSTLYTRCNIALPLKGDVESSAAKRRRLQAYELTIKKEGNINIQVPYNATALGICSDTELLEILFRNGAELRDSQIERAIVDAFLWQPGTLTAKEKNAVARVKFFVSKGLRPTKTRLNSLMNAKCGFPWDGFDETCKDIRNILNISGK